MRQDVISGIRPGFPGLSRSQRQVAHVLLTRSPLTPKGPLDLHVLSTPPAFVLSQDQTLQQRMLKTNPDQDRSHSNPSCSKKPIPTQPQRPGRHEDKTNGIHPQSTLLSSQETRAHRSRTTQPQTRGTSLPTGTLPHSPAGRS